MATGLDYETKSSVKKANGEFDPDDYRMTIGEHLEELRRRLVFALVGFALVLVLCLVYGRRVETAFCAPLINELESHSINPQLVVDELGEGFMVYISISLISAAALASPWMLYQLWLFVAAGLYPHERKYVTRYLPLSIGLLISGMLFVYFLVLPWTIRFFIEWNGGIDIPQSTSVVQDASSATTAPAGGVPATAAPPMTVPALHGDPAHPAEGQIWIDTVRGALKVSYKGQIRIISINSSNLLAQEYKLSHYIDMVVTMLITFGLSFQLPLVVLALERIGIVEVASLKSGRRYVYFAMVIVAAVITPGDVITATIALMFPLIGLYELGIFLAQFGKRNTQVNDS
jgi:sec-independent protein translocase protein TatC